MTTEPTITPGHAVRRAGSDEMRDHDVTSRDKLKRVLPMSLRRFARRSAQTCEYARVAAAEFILPRNCFVQNNPNFNELLGFFPGGRERIRRYNLDYSEGKGKFVADGNRWLQLRLLLRHAAALPTGHYAELGTHRGYSARIIFENMADQSELHCFDTFEGFSEEDVRTERDKTTVVPTTSQFSDTSADLARAYIAKGGVSDRLKLHKGTFPSTMVGLDDVRWRFVHLDADLFAPTLSALRIFYDRIVDGGVILMHDYNNKYHGVQAAADEFFAPLGIVPVPLCDKGGSAVVIKPRVSG